MMLAANLGKPGAPLTILCVGAHCDDVEIGCGGTVLRLLQERPKSTVRWVIFASNPEREAEAKASASEILAGAKSTIKPDLVLTHRVRDLHQDHRIVGELTWNTFRDHLIAEYEIPKYEGDLGNPNLFVPLARSIAQRKIELLMRHFRSQATRRWFRPETFEALMRIRGIECNAAEGFAEGFYVRKLVI